jgi:hypothetical protein
VAAGWNPRMAGVVLCAFFVFGVMTGFSATGRALAVRASAEINSAGLQMFESFAPARDAAGRYSAVVSQLAARLGLAHPAATIARGAASSSTHQLANAGAVAIVERHDGFYGLFPDGELRGPISADAESDLPILSGGALENAMGRDMVGYAELLVRAEAQLSQIVSEMRVDSEGTASLFLDRPRAEVVIDLDNAQLELHRATEVLKRWQGREQLIAALDMTTPDEAVVRLRGADTNLIRRKSSAAPAAHNSAPAAASAAAIGGSR